MEEDIDGSGLVYPVIENVFSNVTNIKTEPVEYDENEYEESIDLVEYETSEYHMSIPNKIILGSKPTTQTVEVAETSASDNWETFPCDECDVVLTTQDDLDTHKMSHSFLIPRVKHSQSSPSSRSSIEDSIPVAPKRQRAMKSTSKASGNWQQTFSSDESNASTHNDLDEHKTSHLYTLLSQRHKSGSSSQSFTEDSVPESRKRQKAIKSTAKSSILNNTFPVSKSYDNLQAVTVSDDRLLCKHCDERFPDETALLKHTYDILPEKMFVCDICEQGFNTKLGLRGHRPVHFRKFQAKEVVSVVDCTRDFLQCTICSCYLKYPGGIIKHMSICHNSQYRESKPIKYSGKCAYCSKVLLNHRQYNMHILKVHSKEFNWKEIAQTGSKSGVRYKCKLCYQIFTTRYSMYKHKALLHPNYKQKNTYETIKDTVASTSQTKTRQSTSVSKNTIIGAPTPKQTLFKCNKCQIHFVTCTTALEHSKRCVLAKGDWKCSKCRRTFTHPERHSHTLQHEHSDKFKVHIVNEKMLHKVICCCPKCELLFDEHSFRKHVSAGCKIVSGIDCSNCNLNFHPDAVAKHQKHHNKYGLSKSDYIIVEFIDAPFEASNDVAQTDKQKLYYCAVCKSNSYTLKYKVFHLSEHCKEKTDTKNCLTCGLLFSFKIYPKHIQDHAEKKYALNDYKFIRMQDDRVIKPPLPEFRKCETCKVRFISLLAKKVHDCLTQKFVKCSKCFNKYESSAYDIHLRFHEYRSLGEREVDCKKVYIYSCVSCNYGFNTYDGLVEHCQDHFIDTQVVKTIPCKFCKLNFADDHDVNHRDVKILKFNYEKLLQPDFLEGFDPVPKPEVDCILSKSMYGMTLNVRNVRLQLEADGPPERSLYKCAQCGLCFDVNNVLEHTQGPCSNSQRYNCNSCTSEFSTKSNAANHSNIHVIFGDDIIFREILFNDQSDSELNEALRTGRKKESLKFRKCQHCELLIKKNEFQKHIEEHGKHKKRKPYTIYPSNGPKKMYTVYRCRKCKAGIMKRPNILRHNCNLSVASLKCTKCSLLVRTYFKGKHEQVHLNLPKFVSKNITVLEFEVHGKNKSKEAEYRQMKPKTSKTYDTRKTDRSYEDNETECEDVEDGENSFVDVQQTDNEAVNDLVKWRLEMRNRLYQCERCHMCFVHKNLLLDHLPKCTPTEASLTCNLCDISFHPSLVSFHDMLHEVTGRNLDDNYIYVINVSFTSDERPWLYKCKKCDVNYLSGKAAGYHFSQNHKCATQFVECDICELKFTVHTRTKHMLLHDTVSGNQFNLEIIDRKLIKISQVTAKVSGVSIDEVTEGESQTTEVSVDTYNERSTNPYSTVDADESSNSVDENNVEVSSNQQSFDLYKCISCNVHYINKHTLVCHMRKNYRVHETLSGQCDICHLNFGLYTLKKHVTMHHNNKENNLVINTITEDIFYDDLYQTDEINSDVVDITEKDSIADTTQLEFENATKHDESIQDNTNTDDVQKAKYASSIDTDDLPLIRGNQEEKIIIIRLYQCKDCKVCVKKYQRVFHVCCSDIQKKHCIQCSLAFRRTDFRQHMRLHRKHREISRKNYKLIKFGQRSVKSKIYKCVPCSTHFVSLQALQWHMDVYNHQTKGEYCEICGLFFGKFSLSRHVYIHHTKLKLSTDKFDIISVSTASNIDVKSKATETSNIVSDVSDTEPTKSFKKLFKCFECDVYFLNQISYYEHMYKHVDLDPTEYIACKMCYMQFLTEDLGVHMKTHRDKTFCLDSLMIEGYQPTNGSPRIESYLAVDGLNSKLVTTTTLSDNEDDTPSIEQLSTVDSTSAKLK